jgi:hypothetical protein
MTVSPAPVTSATSRAEAGSAPSRSREVSHIPGLTRVISTAPHLRARAERLRRRPRLVLRMHPQVDRRFGS